MSWRSTLLIGILVFSLSIGYLWLTSEPPADQSPGTLADQSMGASTAPSSTQTDPSTSAKPTDGDASPDLLDPAKWTPEDMAEVSELRSWRERHGYVNSAGTFGRLSDEDLMPFLEMGDVGALQEMADRQSIKDPESALEYLERAAANGSTAALVRSGLLYSTYARLEKAPFGESADRSATYTSALAYLLAAQIAGDNFTAISATNEILEESEFTDDMKSDACHLASTIVEELNQERQQIGLSPFDLTPAPTRGQDVPSGAGVNDICIGN